MSRVVLITGATRGLGYAIAKLFLENSNIVYINYFKSHDKAQAIIKKYPNARDAQADLNNEHEIIDMINKIKKEEGKIDVLINNAGIALDSTFEDKTKDNFIKTLDTNLIAPFLVTKYASLIMPKNSNIINISSTNGLDTNYPYSLDYDASKAGLISLTHNLAEQFAPNIRVNCIAPGWINTDMNKELSPEFIANECSKIMLGRFAEPEEIAKVVFFVASDDASYLNNSVIRVDGGNR